MDRLKGPCLSSPVCSPGSFISTNVPAPTWDIIEESGNRWNNCFIYLGLFITRLLIKCAEGAFNFDRGENEIADLNPVQLLVTGSASSQSLKDFLKDISCPSNCCIKWHMDIEGSEHGEDVDIGEV